MDYDDVIVHIFLKPIRELYNLEKIWYDAKRIEVSEKGRKLKFSERI
ncbi:MAG: RsfS/YbeB/iojap family protein [Candidatus Aenigmatarchaeota archaeon]